MNTTNKIDIHDYHRKLQRDLASLARDERLLPAQRTTIARFVSDARSGQDRHQRRRRGRRKVSDGRCLKLVWHLRRFGIEAQTPFEQITPGQMERFIDGLEAGTVTKLGTNRRGEPYSPETIKDFKAVIARFYRWLIGEDTARLDELVGWFDMRCEPPEPETFSHEDARRMARAMGPQGRALIMTLFDGGFRPTELFNVRLYDVHLDRDDHGRWTAMVRIRHSKTRPRTIALPLATDDLLFWIERHPSGGKINTQGRIEAKDPNATLITWSYHYGRKILNRLGKEELGERLYFYRFRHSSATFYARHLTEYQMCARYGWVIGSKAVRRYINTGGLLDQSTSDAVRALGRTSQPVPTIPPGAGETQRIMS
ncbi:MAG: hypothetical protein KC996_00840 [Phycisphaerales bacterium]|nr:hypothetical protein [Phycisphaerales bacterium]